MRKFFVFAFAALAVAGAALAFAPQADAYRCVSQRFGDQTVTNCY
jgi:hypothetical protein